MRLLGLVLVVAVGLVAARAAVSFWRFNPDVQAADIPVAPLGDGELRVVVLGTSLSAGTTGWPQAVAPILAGCAARSVDLTVFAEPGVTSDWGAAHVGRVIALQPDLVLIEFAVNDANLRRAISVRKSRQTHRDLVTQLRLQVPDARIVLVAMNPVSGLRGVLRPGIGRYYAAYADLARQLDIGFLNVTRRWNDREDLADVMRDGLHPDSGVAAAVMQSAMAEYLQLPDCD